MDAGVTINRPPRDGHMAFVRTPDSISVELLQDGHARPPSRGRRCPIPASGRRASRIVRIARAAATITSGWSTTPSAARRWWSIRRGRAGARRGDARGWTIGQIWNTHWHPDHTGGNAAIKAATGCTITGPAAEAATIPTLDRRWRRRHRAARRACRAGDRSARPYRRPHRLSLRRRRDRCSSATRCSRWAAAGCSRARRRRCSPTCSGSPRCRPRRCVYCAHEYTQSNGRYALVAEPDNAAIARGWPRSMPRARGRGDRADDDRARAGDATPSCGHVRRGVGERRAAKDAFRG